MKRFNEFINEEYGVGFHIGDYVRLKWDGTYYYSPNTRTYNEHKNPHNKEQKKFSTKEIFLVDKLSVNNMGTLISYVRSDKNEYFGLGADQFEYVSTPEEETNYEEWVEDGYINKFEN